MPESQLKKSPRELRDELEALIRDDLIGPIGGPEEELPEAPVDRYVLGMLAPRFRFGSPLPAAPAGGGDEDDDSIAFDVLPEDDLADGGIMADEGEDGRAEDRPPALDQLVPSAFGLTFALDSDCQELRVRASWGAYSKATSDERLDRDGKPQRVWRRRQCGGAETIKIAGPGALASFAPDPAESEVVVRGLVRDRGGQRLVSLFLINGQFSDGGRSVPRWLCQASLAVEHPAGESVFVRRTIDAIGLAPEVDRAELTGLEMLYRDTVELAVGHGVGVQATLAPGRLDRGLRLQTAPMPSEEVPRTDAPGAADFTDPAISEPFTAALPALDMKMLSEAADEELPPLLSPLADAYSAWIDAQERRIDEPAARLAGHEPKAREHIAQARVTLGRIRAGVANLADPDVADAFRFANHAMWQQRVHTLAGEARRRDSALKLHAAVEAADEPGNRSWRPFQLAFVLLNLPALADPSHPERAGTEAPVDLLFFPTGGGKTEAYLGLTAFAIAIRRLQGELGGREGRDGVVVLMRYTLRLLTLQQFQRAAALLCACELQRRRLYGKGETVEQRRWGATPMRIGLWVGQASTPNRTEDAEQWVKQARQRSGGVRGASPMQLARCPWCGSELQGGRDIEVDTDRGRTILSCSDTSGQCAFTPRNSPDEGLPVVVVDDEMYRLLPALVIATVDKFAQMPWEGRAQALFGQVSRHCDRHGYLTPGEEHPDSHPKRRSLPAVIVTEREALRPPDLIIQDELHLISGPLGSLVGLYETAVDELCAQTVDGKRLRPKVIASTATIRRAGDQVARLFDRRLQVFPPPGLDARDSFFALQRDADEDRDQRPGRRYLGVCAPGRRFKQVLIRVYVAQLQAAWTVLGRQPGPAADAYMTLVGYFNSLRELGGMRRLVEDDVQGRMFGGGGEGRWPPDPRGADLAQVRLGHPAGARPARRLSRVAGRPPAAQGRGDVVDRRAAGDEHDLGRRRRPATRRDGRRRPAEVDHRVHPGHQPRRAPASRARAHGLQLGPATRPVALRDLLPLPPDVLPAGRGALGDAVRPPGARPWPDRRARLAAPAQRHRVEPQLRRRTRRSRRPARRPRTRGDPGARRRPDRPRRRRRARGADLRAARRVEERGGGRAADARVPQARQERFRRVTAAGARD